MHRHLFLFLLTALSLTQCAKTPSTSTWYDEKQSIDYVAGQTDHPSDQACLLANVLATPAHQTDAKRLLTHVPSNQPCAWLAQGKLALLNHQPASAAKQFNLIQATDGRDDYLQSRHLLGFALQAQNQWRSALNIWTQVSGTLPPSQQTQYNLGLWQLLQSTPKETLRKIRSNNPEVNGWLTLALATNVDELSAWQSNYPNHPAQQLLKHPLSDQPIPDTLVLALPKQGANFEASRAIQQGLLAMHFQQPTSIHNIQWIDSNLNDWPKQLPDKPIIVLGLLSKEEVNGITQQYPHARILNLQSTETTNQPQVDELNQSTTTQGLQIAQYLARSGYQKPLILSQQDSVNQQLAESVITNWPYRQTTAWHFSPQLSTMDHQTTIQSLLQVDESQVRIDQIKTALDAPLIAKPHQAHAFDVAFIAGDRHFVQEARAIFNFNDAANLPIFATQPPITHPAPSRHDFSHMTYFDLDHQSLNSPNEQQADAQIIKSLKQLYPKHFVAYQADYLKGINAYHIIQNLPLLQNFNAWTCMGINGLIQSRHHQMTQPISAWHQHGSLNQTKDLPTWQIWQLPVH